MTEIQSFHTIQQEVEYGESREQAIIRRWQATSPLSRRTVGIVKTPDFAPFDYLLLDRRGFPVAYLEVKVRRTPLAKYGDAICPLSKHKAALAIYAEFSIPSFLITEYGCGTLAEVALSVSPLKAKDVKRRDRPSMAPVPHAVYTLPQLTILKEANK